VIQETEQAGQRQRVFRDQDNEGGSLFTARVWLQEIAND
jgi:hypothetical protein